MTTECFQKNHRTGIYTRKEISEKMLSALDSGQADPCQSRPVEQYPFLAIGELLKPGSQRVLRYLLLFYCPAAR
jgi:hypothetical protein